MTLPLSTRVLASLGLDADPVPELIVELVYEDPDDDPDLYDDECDCRDEDCLHRARP